MLVCSVLPWCAIKTNRASEPFLCAVFSFERCVARLGGLVLKLGARLLFCRTSLFVPPVCLQDLFWVSLVAFVVALTVSMEGLVSCHGRVGCSEKGFVFQE